MSSFGNMLPPTAPMAKSRLRSDSSEDEDEMQDSIGEPASHHGVIRRSSSGVLDSEVDARTQSTAYEALNAKYSACTLNYFSDKYLKAIVAAQHFKGYQKKPPLINRGYYTRITSIQHVVESFLSQTHDAPARQIISLGSGLDTMSLEILERNLPNLHLYEVDFASIISQKVDLFLKVPIIMDLLNPHIPAPDAVATTPESSLALKPVFEESAGEGTECLSPISEGEETDSPRTKCSTAPQISSVSVSPSSATALSGRLSSRSLRDLYRTEHGFKLGPLALLSADLREHEAVRNILLSSGVDPTIPTLFITECVLLYISREPVLSLCSSLASSFSNAAWVTYDMMNPNDRFGKTMVQNLKSARHNVYGLVEFPTLADHEQRFTQTGWNAAISTTMLNAYKLFVSTEDAARIAKLEILDEVEEWELIMNHYALTVAVNGTALDDLLLPFRK